MDGGHIVVSVKLDDKSNKYFSSYTLVDCSATGYTFVDEEFVCDHNLPLYMLKTPCLLEVIDGRPIELGLITPLTRLRMSIDSHQEDIPMFVTKIGHYSVVLGLLWLRRHDVHIGFGQNTLTFDSEFCLHRCSNHGNAVMFMGILIPTPEKPNITMIASSTFMKLAKKKKHFALMIYAIDQALYAHEVRDRARRMAIYTVVPELRMDLPAAVAAATIEDDKIWGLVPAEYHEFLPLFKKMIADVLPPH